MILNTEARTFNLFMGEIKLCQYYVKIYTAINK